MEKWHCQYRGKELDAILIKRTAAGRRRFADGGIYPQSCADAHDSSFCGRSQGGVASAEARRWLSDRPRHPFGCSLLIDLYQGDSWQVAAALSAAVTTSKPNGDRPHSHGRASSKECASLFPAALRERGSGGEALLLEKRPLPQNPPRPPNFPLVRSWRA